MFVEGQATNQRAALSCRPGSQSESCVCLLKIRQPIRELYMCLVGEATNHRPVYVSCWPGN